MARKLYPVETRTVTLSEFGMQVRLYRWASGVWAWSYDIPGHTWPVIADVAVASVDEAVCAARNAIAGRVGR